MLRAVRFVGLEVLRVETLILEVLRAEPFFLVFFFLFCFFECLVELEVLSLEVLRHTPLSSSMSSFSLAVNFLISPFFY